MELKKYLVKNKARENIEAEEIFLDAEAIHSLEDKGKLEKPIKRGNFLIFLIFIVFCLLGLFFRAGYLQVVKGDYYQNLAKGNRLRIYPLAAPRGMIYDSNGQPLLYNIPSFDLTVNLIDFLDSPPQAQEKILEEIAVALKENETEKSDQTVLSIQEKLRKKIEDYKEEVSQLVLIRGVDRPTALILESLAVDWPAWRIEKNVQRQYLNGSYFSHILGYTGQVSRQDLEEHPEYLLNDQIGKAGLECQYDDLLRGKPGQEQIEVDSFGKTQKILAAKPAQPGQSLVLFTDQGLQEKLYQSLESMIKQLSFSSQPTKRAAAVAIDPKNGGILALVSLPSFDNNLFAQGISQNQLTALENDPDQPFINRAVAGQYPSGSVIKPLIAAAALEEKIISPYQQINCQGGISVPNKYNPQIVYYFPDWKSHGQTNIIEAIAESCNVFFYAIGGGFDRQEGLGIDRIKEYLQYFGLGQSTHLDLPQESIGLIPDQEWKEKNKPGEKWGLGDTYHVAIGQGDILVTPIQMAAAISSIANGGTLWRPRLVDKIIDSEEPLEAAQAEEISAEIIKKGFIEADNLQVVQKGMRQAVLTGSAQALADLPVKAAGKTGTAQFGSKDQTHAWFVGYAPYQNPEIVLAVLIEGGGEGHQSAVPVAKEVFKWYFSQ